MALIKEWFSELVKLVEKIKKLSTFGQMIPKKLDGR